MATIVAHRYKPYCGTLLGCVRQWQCLPAKDKSTAFIRLNAASGNPILNSREIDRLAEIQDRAVSCPKAPDFTKNAVRAV
jgi:hypothetical protein